MRKALINNLTNGEKVAASTYSVEIQFLNGETKHHEIVNETFENVFEAINEIYASNDDQAKKIVIEVIEGR